VLGGELSGGRRGVAAVEVLSALSDPQRLGLLARIAEAGQAGCELDAAAGAGASPRVVRKQLARLTAAGLVEARGPVLVARLDRNRDALEEVAPAAGDDEAAGPARVRALFRRGRLVDIPRAPELRQALLEHLAERFFDPGRTYTEPEVNALLREVHDDHAALRRYLVDSGLLRRDDAGRTYRRAAEG
jgi:hypothetical protein